MKFISFVVDINPLHYYQAQLLIHSIFLNTDFPKENIVVQCIEGVDDNFIAYLDQKGVSYTFVSPYLDQRYCNKLTQLEYFLGKDIESIILLDADMYVTDNAIYTLSSDKVMGKVVDAPNPPLGIVEDIFKEASLSLPVQVTTDWNVPENITVAGNFNGGFYYIPGKLIERVNELWRKWASWLFERKYLFKNPAYAIHTDQLSFAMALKDGDIPYTFLSTNYNFPLHVDAHQHYLNQTEPIHLLHYHREIDGFGFLNDSKVGVVSAKTAVELANDQIATLDEIEFYYRYKISTTLEINNDSLSSAFKENFRLMCQKYDDIVCYLHAGTPKTATTSFQYTCVENIDYLKSMNVLYPTNYTQSGVPKHQWLVPLLLSGDEKLFYQKFEEVLIEASTNQCKTIVLSTEGIYNHWWDFPEKSKEMFSILTKTLHVKLWLVLREPASFLYSFYQQNLKNPKTDLVKCYGQDWSFERMFQDKWFVKHMDYLSFIDETMKIFGKDNVILFTYDKSILKRLFHLMGIDINKLVLQNSHNVGLSSVSIELLKTLNRFDVMPSDKNEIIDQLMLCDNVLKKYEFDRNCQGKEKVKKYFSLQQKVLASYYNIRV